MTRTEAIATITKHLDRTDDATLEAVAANLEGKPLSTMTSGEALEAIPGDSLQPRALSEREQDLLEQSKDDFRLGRTRTLAESKAFVATELERRRFLRGQT